MEEKGFTLLELSIVIVIIGLIVAGVSAGQSLVQQSKLRSITADFNYYTTAVNSFRLQYDALPGDLSNAYDYWSTTCDATDTNCNGDGNGAIEFSGTAADNEIYRAWQHLYLAGLTKENVTGVGGGTGDEGNPGVNIPSSAYGSEVGLTLRTGPLWSGGPIYTYLNFGELRSNSMAANPFFTGAEAYSIDVKMDDGLSKSGKVHAAHPDFGLPYCRSQNTTPAEYNLSSISNHCFLRMALPY